MGVLALVGQRNEQNISTISGRVHASLEMMRLEYVDTSVLNFCNVTRILRSKQHNNWRLTMAGPKFESHEHYIQSATEEAQAILTRIQALVESKVPKATRCISYNLPAFKLGKTFFYFAAFKKHIGVYPPMRVDEALVEELAPYRNEKGNLAFPLDKPIPYALIGRVAVALSKQYGK